MMMHRLKYLALIVLTVAALMLALPSSSAWACGCGPCCGPIGSCASTCVCTSKKQTTLTMDHITEAFNQHRKWMVDIYFKDDKPGTAERDTIPGILAALQIMTSQLTAATTDQIFMIGAMLDAKHQLETQRLFQQLTAEAHRDYHPSEELCEVGTMTRSLATSARKADLAQITFANRMNERQLLSGDIVSTNSEESDFWSRLRMFVDTFCNPNDNGKGLKNLCKSGGAKDRINRDVDYTASVDMPLTLNISFAQDGADKTPDEENIFALSANLYAHEPLPDMNAANLLTGNNEPTDQAYKYMDLRALAAKRSVAQNTLAAVVGMKAQGAPEVSPFLYSALKQMSNEGLEDTEIQKYLGDKPSYYAQMEMLTKKIYQHPGFFTDLYDKPANVMRKEAAMQAVELMQKRDIYRSLLRSEMLFAVILETSLAKQQKTVEAEIERLDQEGKFEQLE